MTAHFQRADRGQERHARSTAIGSFEDARIYASGKPPDIEDDLSASHQPDARAGARKLRHAGDRAVLATARPTSSWPIAPVCWRAGYRLQYQQLLARPFLLAAMVLLAASVSLRFFRFGGVQKMVLSGISAGFLLFVLSKITEDMSKSELLSPVVAAWIPVVVGGLTGFVALLYQEDG